jgi:hypothetical protein
MHTSNWLRVLRIQRPEWHASQQKERRYTAREPLPHTAFSALFQHPFLAPPGCRRKGWHAPPQPDGLKLQAERSMVLARLPCSTPKPPRAVGQDVISDVVTIPMRLTPHRLGGLWETGGHEKKSYGGLRVWAWVSQGASRGWFVTYSCCPT